MNYACRFDDKRYDLNQKLGKDRCQCECKKPFKQRLFLKMYMESYVIVSVLNI